MGLRLAEGVELERLEAIAGLPIDRLLEPAALERFVAESWITLHDGRIAATAGGRQRLNGILAALLDRAPDQACTGAAAR